MFCIFKYFSPSFIMKEQFMPQVVVLFILVQKFFLFLFFSFYAERAARFSHCTVTKYFNSSRSHRRGREWKCGLFEKAMTSHYYDYPQFMKLKCSWNQFCYWIYLNFSLILFISSFLFTLSFFFPLPSYFVAF